MFERFTDRARRVVVLAQEEARMLNHSYIGTEHILLGLIHEGEGVAAKALESMDISLGAVREKVQEDIGQGQQNPPGHIPFTPRAKKVLELSLREALQLGHNYIGTEHILLGLIREGEGVAAQVLVQLGADLNRVRQTVIQLLSGYQGGADIADAIVETVRRIKAANPKALYACDPVMGNAKSGCFVSDEIPPLLRDRVVPVADIITPNQFELGYLTDSEVGTLDQTLAAVKKAQEIGPKTVLVTSVKRPETPEGQIEMLAVDGDRAFLVSTPLLPFKRNGSGDVTAALFTGHYTETSDVKESLRRTASSVYDLLENTYEAETAELQLIQSQDVFAHPRMQFHAEEL